MAYLVQYVHSGSAVETYLAVDCSTGSVAITLNDATGWPSPTGSQVSYGTIKPALSGESKFTYTSRSGNVLSGVTWNADGTTSSATYTAGPATVIRHGFTANEADEANAAARNTLGRVTAANQLLVSDSATTLAKLDVAASRIVGRKATGDIDDLTAAEVLAILALSTGDISGLAEFIRDTIGTALVAGTNVTVTVNDGADTITVAASGGGAGSITANTASVTSTESTTSDSYVALTTPGPSITQTVGASGNALVIIGCEGANDTADDTWRMSFTVDGDTASHIRSFGGTSSAASRMTAGSRATLITGLSAGSHTYVSQYRRQITGSASFTDRTMIVITW